MTFMHEGGFAMWAILAIAVGSGAFAIARRKKNGAKIGIYGGLACLVFGVLGMSLGLGKTTEFLETVEAAEKAQVLAWGINESINNSIFGALTALALGVLAVVLSKANGATRRAA